MGLGAEPHPRSHPWRGIRHPRLGERSLSIEMEVRGLIVNERAAPIDASAARTQEVDDDVDDVRGGTSSAAEYAELELVHELQPEHAI